MVYSSTELKKYIEEDIRKYQGIRRPLRAGVLELQLRKKLRITKLHPNPEDEFTWPNVGPNDSIVAKYMTDIHRHLPMEPIMVEKMFPEGYTILNGHHRWAASMRTGAEYMAIRVVNMTHPEDVLRQIDRSDRVMRAAFDLDEVLLSADPDMQETGPGFPYSILFRERLRIGTVSLFQELHRLGFDIWVYTHTAASEEQTRTLFRGYGIEPDIYINGAGSRQKNQKPIESFNGKYRFTVHIDTHSMIFTRPKTKEFEEVELSCQDRGWALNVMREIETRSDPDYIFTQAT